MTKKMKVDLIQDSAFPPSGDEKEARIARIAHLFAEMSAEEALTQMANMLGSYAANFEVQSGGEVKLLGHIKDMVDQSYEYHLKAVRQILNPEGDA